MTNRVELLDHGYLEFIESWGHGKDGEGYAMGSPDNKVPDDYECGIIEAARQSTQGNFRGWEQDEKLLKFLHQNKHSTPFEFAGMVIEVQAPIAVFREWHRHRTQSYNEMSARYSPLPDLNYIPTIERLMMVSKTNKQAGTIKGADELTEEKAELFQLDLREEYARIEWVYQHNLSCGVPKELARLVLPVGRYSRMRASANLRNWLGFLTLRMDPAAQWEIQRYANAVGDLISQHFPHTWKLFSEGRQQ